MPQSPTIDHSAPAGLFHRFTGFLASKVAERIELYYARQSLRVELERLDYRELRDLGINEAGVDGYVATWRPSR